MATHDTYRTNDGRYYFSFIFENKGGYYMAHIASQPSYGSRASDLHSTHRLSSDYSGCSYRICFGNDNDVPTLSRVRKYAEAWSEATAKYIDTGIKFG